MADPNSKKHVVVVGAGVIGLTTAVRLLENGYQVSILAHQWPQTSMGDGRYTSAWAGAQWRTHAPPGSEAATWDAKTYAHWQALTAHKTSLELSQIGVFPVRLTEYRVVPQTPAVPWWASLSSDFRQLEEEELPGGVATGMSMPSFVADPGRYLIFLLEKAKALGARVYDVELPRDEGIVGLLRAAKAQVLEGDEDAKGPLAFVNATGLFAAELVAGEKLFPVRGQTLLIKGEAKELKTCVFDSKPGNVIAIMPRVGTGTTIIGSTRHPESWDLSEDKGDTEWLLSKARTVASELFVDGKEPEVLKVNVGLRPHREGGARVELEELEEFVVVHEYGHDGAGYQNSVGSADKVVDLIKEF